MSNQEWRPVTHENCGDVQGPFYHGTSCRLAPGEQLLPGFESNYEEGRGHIYLVEPVGPFEDDPNLTNKRFPGNPTRSYRTRQALRIVSEVKEWEGHAPEAIRQMLDHLAELRRSGRATIED
jgi:rifampin ADP-ribosylating transferase